MKAEDILVIYDDYHLPLGKIRIRPRGSAGGHNGIESVMEYLQTDEIKRIRVGVGPIPEGVNQVEYVLGQFNEKESDILEKVLCNSAEAVLYLLSHRIEDAMGKYNRNPAPNKI